MTGEEIREASRQMSGMHEIAKKIESKGRRMTDTDVLTLDAGQTCTKCGEPWRDNLHRCQDELVARLRSLLRGVNCPRPCNHRPDEFTIGNCIDAGECGCIYGDMEKRVGK